MSLPAVAPGAQSRARRWDALILGSGLSALTAAARLGMAGHRVLVVEEETARTGFEGLREPFHLAGARDKGVIDLCLKELKLSLIDRRRIAEEELAYQVIGDDLRLDVGKSELSADEWVAWGLCKPDIAGPLIRSLHDASEAERKALLSAPLVRLGRRLGRGRPTLDGRHHRGLPADLANPTPELAPVLDAQIRALSNLATSRPAPECQARLLGSGLAGGAGYGGPPPWLHGLLRNRVEAVFGEFRTLARRFRLVSALNQPGIEIEGSRELWLGRILVIAAPPSAVASCLDPADVPGFLPSQRKVRERVVIHLRIERSVLPEGLCRRAILMRRPESGRAERADPIALSIFPRESDPRRVDLLARCMLAEGESRERLESEICERVLALIPFSEGKVERREVQRPEWDSEDLLEDPRPGEGWPGETDLRLSAKPPVYLLDRTSVAGLGVEGDLLLGLRSGEALGSELG